MSKKHKKDHGIKIILKEGQSVKVKCEKHRKKKKRKHCCW